MNEAHSKKETDPAQDVNLAPGLYIVATPIGNLRDITLRALDTLRAADEIFCEDTRVSKKLLGAYGISGRLNTYHDHSDEKVRARIIALIESGKAAALISDAGMPLISDPGYKLVRELCEAGANITSLPGANAPLAALQLSGLPSDQFSFLGFLPPKQKARQDVLRRWNDVPGTLIAFENAGRLTKALSDIAELMPGRDMAVVREITKMYEEARRGNAQELLAYYEEHGAPKGEIVIVMGPAAAFEISDEALRMALKTALESCGTKEAAAHVSAQTGISKKKLYEMALEIAKE